MRATAERFGVAFGWRWLPDGRCQSQLHMRVSVQELLQAGFEELLLILGQEHADGHLLAALMRQYEVLDAVDRPRAKGGKEPLGPPFYACALPIGPGEEVMRGSGQITAPVGREHIAAHWLKQTRLPLVEAQLGETVAWSWAASAQISY